MWVVTVCVLIIVCRLVFLAILRTINGLVRSSTHLPCAHYTRTRTSTVHTYTQACALIGSCIVESSWTEEGQLDDGSAGDLEKERQSYTTRSLKFVTKCCKKILTVSLARYLKVAFKVLLWDKPATFKSRRKTSFRFFLILAITGF